MDLDFNDGGSLVGGVFCQAMPGGVAGSQKQDNHFRPADNGLRTVLTFNRSARRDTSMPAAFFFDRTRRLSQVGVCALPDFGLIACEQD
jgi:hypothetical protein